MRNKTSLVIIGVLAVFSVYAGELTIEADVTVSNLVSQGSVEAAAFIGDGSALTNLGIGDETDPQVGTIASNSLPVWNGSSLVTGTIVDNGNIGIGATDPDELLHIVGPGNTSIHLESSTGERGSDFPGILFESDNLEDRKIGAGIFFGRELYGTGKLHFSLSTNRTWNASEIDPSREAVMTLYDDKVGIGTISPGHKLDVHGTVSVSALTVASNLLVGGILSGDGSGLTNLNLGIVEESDPLFTNSVAVGITSADIANWNSGVATETDPQVGVISDHYVPNWNGLALVTGTIYDDGNIGIGTTSPNSTLHINGSINKIPLRVQVDGGSRLTVGSNGGVSIGTFQDTPPTKGLYVFGDVGIGTAMPGSKLDVRGTVSATALMVTADLVVGGILSGDGSGLTNLSGVGVAEADPVFTNSVAAGITSTDIANWNSGVFSGALDVISITVESNLVVGGTLNGDGSGLSNLNVAVDWNELSGIPAGIADGDDVVDADADTSNELNSALIFSNNVLKLTDAGGELLADLSSLAAVETDPTVPEEIKDGIDWTELSNIPTELADGDDVADADANISNELNTALSFSNNVLRLTDAGGEIVADLSSLDAVETDPTVPEEIKDGIDWSELSGIPTGLADGDDVIDADADPTNEFNFALNFSNHVLKLTDGGGELLADLSSLVDIETDPTVPEAIKDGIDWYELIDVPIDLLDGDDLGITVETDPTVPAEIKDGIDWSELSGIPTELTDGDDVVDADANVSNELNTALSFSNALLTLTDAGGTLSTDLSSLVDMETDPTVPANIKDGIDWAEIGSRPAGLDDGDDVGVTVEADPTVLASVKDGVSWDELSGIPTDIADGDQVGLTNEIDPLFLTSIAATITSNDIAYWNSISNELNLVSLTVQSNVTVGGVLTGDGSGLSNLNLNAASETDPVFSSTVAAEITSTDIDNWNSGAVSGALNVVSIHVQSNLTVDGTLFGDGSGLTNLNLGAVTETDPTVPPGIKDGIDWSELTGIPTNLLDGDDVVDADASVSNEWVQSVSFISSNHVLKLTDAGGTWTADLSSLSVELDPTVLESVKDGISWTEITARPAGLDDGDQVGITTETDPTVPATIKDGITWNEVTSRPAGLDDGDDVGITVETDPTVLASVKDGVDWDELTGIPVDIHTIGSSNITSGITVQNLEPYQAGFVVRQSIENSRFIQTFGGGSYDLAGYSPTSCSDGSLLLIGHTRSYGAGNYDILLLKMNGAGTLLWAKTFGGSSDDFGYSVIEASDGSFLVAGSTETYGAGNHDALLLKMNADGTLLWAKTFGGIDHDRSSDLVETSDGSIFLAGYTKSYGAGGDDLCLIKTDGDGNILWARTAGGANNDIAHSVIETSEGNILLVGYVYTLGLSSYNAILLQYDQDGTFLWSKLIGGSRFDYGRSVVEGSDGALFLLGYTDSYGAGNQDILLSKMDADGTLLWTKTTGGSDYDYGYDLIQTMDGNLVIAAYTESYGNGLNDLLLLKYDPTGALLWAKTFGGTGNEFTRSVIETPDGNLLFIAETYSYGAGVMDWLILKVNSDGEIPGYTNLVDVSPTVQSITPQTATPPLSFSTPSPSMSAPSPTVKSWTPSSTQIASWSSTNIQDSLTVDAQGVQVRGGLNLLDGAIRGDGSGLTDLAWSALTGIPSGLADGDDVGITNETDPTVLESVKDGVSWSELSAIPSDFADGNISWSELSGIPSDIADGDVSWDELSAIPSDIADGDDGLTSESDPTVLASVKDGVSWSELSGIPSDFADGDISWSELSAIPSDIADGDDVGITNESDPQVGANTTSRIPKWNGSALVTGTIYDNGNIGIGTTSPNTKLHVNSSTGSNPLRIQVNSSEKLIVTSAGNVGVGTTSPSEKLDVSGTVKAASFSGSGAGLSGVVKTESDPTVLASVKDGVSWSELSGIPSDFSDGDVSWSELSGIPGDFANGDISWTELSGIPSDIADGDDVGITSESDPQVGANTTSRIPKWNGSALVTGTIYDNGTGNIGIGTTSPSAKLDVVGTVEATSFSGSGSGLSGVVKTESDPQVGTINSSYVPKWNGSALVTGKIYDNGTGNIGIGTTSPSAKLDVVGTVEATAFVGDGSGLSNVPPGTETDPQVGANSTSYVPRWNGSALVRGRIYDNGSGRIGIGTSSTSQQLNVNGSAYLSGSVFIGTSSSSYRLHVNGTAYATGASGALSDRRHKKNISDLPIDALQVIRELRAVMFNWKEPQDAGMEGSQLGFIAQEVEETLPDVVFTQDNEEQTKGLKYNALIPVLTKAVQQLSEENDALRAEKDAQIAKLIQRIEALEADKIQ